MTHTSPVTIAERSGTFYTVGKTDGVCRIHMHEGQKRCWQSTKRFVFMISGTQSGKTSYGPWWLNREIDRCGSGDYLAVTTSYDLFKLKMLPEMKNVFERVLNRGRYWPGVKIIELRDPATGQFWAKRAEDSMWGRIILRSTQSDSGLEASTANAAWLDEAGQDEFTLQHWEAVLRRLSISQGRVLATTTIYNLGWIRTEVYEKWKNGDPNFDVIQFSSLMNPAFPAEEFERAKASLPDWRFRMFYKGEFTKPTGLIYADFSDDLVVRPFKVPTSWTRVVGVDFGGANTCLVFFAQNPQDDVWYLYDEYLEGGKSTREHASHMTSRPEDPDDTVYVGGSLSEKQARRDWQEGGVSIIPPPFDNVEAGIDKVTQAIKTKKMRVFSTCKGWRDEIGSYRRQLDADGAPSEKISEKRKFHRMDATRYAMSYLLGRGGIDIIALGSYPGLGGI